MKFGKMFCGIMQFEMGSRPGSKIAVSADKTGLCAAVELLVIRQVSVVLVRFSTFTFEYSSS